MQNRSGVNGGVMEMLLPERSLSTGVDNSLRTLIVQNLPHDIRSRELWNLFRQFPGFSGSALMVKRCGTASSKASALLQQQQQQQQQQHKQEWFESSECSSREGSDDVDNCAGLEPADAAMIGEYSLFNRPEAVRVVGLVTFDCHSQAKHALSVIDGTVFDYRTPNVALFVRFSKTNPVVPLCPSDVPRSCLFYQYSRTTDARTFSTVPSFAPQPHRSVPVAATPCCRTLFLCNIADSTAPSELHSVLAQFASHTHITRHLHQPYTHVCCCAQQGPWFRGSSHRQRHTGCWGAGSPQGRLCQV